MAESKNVAVGKPRIGGAVHTALASQNNTLPTDTTTALSGFTALGYVSADGLRNGTSMSTSEFKAWGGDTVFTAVPGKTDTFTFKLIEALNPEVLKVVYGSENVEGSLDKGLSVSATNGDYEDRVWVFDMDLRGVLKRIVVFNAKITNVSEIVYKDDEAVGYEITITCAPNNSGITHMEYMKNKA